MRTAFVSRLTELMRKHSDIITLTPDVGFSVFEGIQEAFPHRFINTGVTEANTIGMATGLAFNGFTVYVYAQAPFLTMRCFEQVRLDLAYGQVNVKIIGSAAGFSATQLGVSHHAIEDVALMRLLPGMTIFSPGDPYEATELTKASYTIKGPVYIRIGKSGSPRIHMGKPKIRVGRAVRVRNGDSCTLIATGSILPMAGKIADVLAKENVNASLFSMHTIKPLDEALIVHEAKRTKRLFTIEEHSIIGGLGSAVAEVLAEANVKIIFLRFGIRDRFTSIAGSQEYLLAHNGLSVDQITKTILSTL